MDRRDLYEVLARVVQSPFDVEEVVGVGKREVAGVAHAAAFTAMNFVLAKYGDQLAPATLAMLGDDRDKIAAATITVNLSTCRIADADETDEHKEIGGDAGTA